MSCRWSCCRYRCLWDRLFKSIVVRSHFYLNKNNLNGTETWAEVRASRIVSMGKKCARQEDMATTTSTRVKDEESTKKNFSFFSLLKHSNEVAETCFVEQTMTLLSLLATVSPLFFSVDVSTLFIVALVPRMLLNCNFPFVYVDCSKCLCIFLRQFNVLLISALCLCRFNYIPFISFRLFFPISFVALTLLQWKRWWLNAFRSLWQVIVVVHLLYMYVRLYFVVITP